MLQMEDQLKQQIEQELWVEAWSVSWAHFPSIFHPLRVLTVADLVIGTELLFGQHGLLEPPRRPQLPQRRRGEQLRGLRQPGDDAEGDSRGGHSLRRSGMTGPSEIRMVENAKMDSNFSERRSLRQPPRRHAKVNSTGGGVSSRVLSGE